MIGEFFAVIVEAVCDYLLPWRVLCCIGLALIISFVVCWLLGEPGFRLDIVFAGLLIGLITGIAWQVRR